MRSDWFVRVLLAVATTVMLSGAAFDAALAQNSGGTPPAPAPSPSPSPAPFHSPFGGPDKAPDSSEAQAFNSLMDLYDAMKDAEARLKWAGRCGSASDVADAYDALQAATAAFNDALTHYILDYSGVIYPHRGMVRQQLNDRYDADKKTLLDELAKRDKKEHPVGDCPNNTYRTGPTPPKPRPDLPPPPNDQPINDGAGPNGGGAGGSLAPNVTLPKIPPCFGLPVDKDDMIDELRQLRAQARTNLPLGAEKGDPEFDRAWEQANVNVKAIDDAIDQVEKAPYCPPAHHSSFWDHFSVGVGVGVGGGGGDHHHDDRNQGDTQPPPSGGRD